MIIERRFLRILKLFSLIGLLSALVAVTPQSASADPFGDEYDILLDGYLGVVALDPNDPNYFEEVYEGHLSIVTFDGLADLVENDLVPPPPFVPGNDLIATEMVTLEPDGSETISIWIDGHDPAGPFPTPGAPLFNNPLDPNSVVFFDINGIEWPGMPGFVTSYSLEVSFGDLLVPIEPLDVFIEDGFDGADVSDDEIIEAPFPISLSFEIDPADFTGPSGEPATDLHLEFNVVHIPEPSSFLLLAVGGFALALRRRR